MALAAPYNLFNKQEIVRLERRSSLTPSDLSKLAKYGENNGYYLLIAIERDGAAKPIYRPFDYIRRPNYWNMLLGPSGGIWKTLTEAKGSFGSLTSSSSGDGDVEDGSDKWEQLWGSELSLNTAITFYRLSHTASPTARGKKSAVHAFNFVSSSNFDLKAAQIYQCHELATYRQDRITHCLLFAMKQAGVHISIVESTAYACLSGGTRYVASGELKKVASHIQRPINLSRIRLNGKKQKHACRVEVIGKEFKESPAIDLAIYENHIFHNPVVDVNIHILKRSIQPDYKIPPRATMSKKPLLWVVHSLYTLGAFTAMTPDQHNEGRDEKNDDFIATPDIQSKINRECLDINQREFKCAEHKQKDEVYFAADCESFTGSGLSRHELALIGITKVRDPCDWKSADVKIWTFKEEPVKHMLQYVYREVRGYNMSPDQEIQAEVDDMEIDQTEYEEFEDHISAVEEKAIPVRRKRKRDRDTATAVIYFHNLRYDRAVLQRDLSIFDVLEYDNSTYFMKVRYANLTIEFRDSWKHLDMSLSMMSSALNLPNGISKKECGVNYDYFSPDNFDTRCSVSSYIDQADGKFDREEITSILNETSQYDNNTDTFSPWHLYRHYLHFDVLVLACALYVYQSTGIELSASYLQNETELDPLSFVTKSSFSKSLARQGGVFDHSYEYCGALRQFIMSSIRGGRVACHPEFEGKLTYASPSGIMYMDAVSEYPSAMVQMCDDYGGFPTGPASIMDSIDCIHDPKTFYYIVQISITEIPRKVLYSYPIIAYKAPNGETVDYIQDLPDGKPFEVTIGKIDLEEYIRFHDIKFNFISGIKWLRTTSPNPEWGNMIRHLFDQRKIYKKAGNIPMSNQIKNNMNSQYGSSIPKIKEYTFTMLSKGRPDLEQAIANIFHSIIEFYDLGKTVQLKRTKLDMTYTSCLFGSIVLCMSRRINNRLLYALEQSQVYALYGDTDSCMFDSQFLPIIREEYKRLWNMDLEGSELGQFHSDFEAIPGCINNDEIRSSKMWLVGKKIYCHETYGPGPNGTTVYGRQYKCKGVPKKSIDYAADVINPEDFMAGISSLYDRLIPQSSDYDADGELIDRSVAFLCNPYGSVRFVYAKDRTVMTPTEPFFRKVSRKPVRDFEIMRL
jgi:hypothetical protein